MGGSVRQPHPLATPTYHRQRTLFKQSFAIFIPEREEGMEGMGWDGMGWDGMGKGGEEGVGGERRGRRGERVLT